MLSAALFVTFSLSLAAEDVWLWPIEGRKAGEGILYRPQDRIGEEFNFDNLFIAAPEGTRVLCPADAVVGFYCLNYHFTLTSSSSFGAPDKPFDEVVSEGKEEWRARGMDVRAVSIFMGLQIGDKTLWITGLRRDNSLPTGTHLRRGDVLGTVGYSYRVIYEPHISLSVSSHSKADDPMTPFGLRTTFRKPEPVPTKFHLTREEAVADYQQLASSVKEIYPSLDDLMTEPEYDAFVSEQLARIPADGIALKDFARLIKDYNAVIHDSHLSISCQVPTNPQEKTQGLGYYYPPLFFGQVAVSDSLTDHACVVLIADSTHAAYVGRRIARIDGKPAADLISITRRNSTIYDAGVTSVGDYNACFWNSIDYGLELGPQPKGRTIVYEFEDGERLELPMAKGFMGNSKDRNKWWNARQTNRYKNSSFGIRQLNDSVLYIGISTFGLNDVDCDSVVDAIHQAERDSIPYLIFDVRNNYGGAPEVQDRLTRALLGRTPDRPHTSYLKVNAALFKSPTMNWPEGDTIFGDFKPLEGRKGLYKRPTPDPSREGGEKTSTTMASGNESLPSRGDLEGSLSSIDSLGYNGRLYVLIDSRSASASAFLAGAIKRNDRGYIVGRETMSAYHTETCVKFANIYLPNSQFSATIPMVRVVIDETVSDRLPAPRGVIPDCDIPMSEAEFHYDGDYILDRTLQLIADGTYLDLTATGSTEVWRYLPYAATILAALALILLSLFLRRRCGQTNKTES